MTPSPQYRSSSGNSSPTTESRCSAVPCRLGPSAGLTVQAGVRSGTRQQVGRHRFGYPLPRHAYRELGRPGAWDVRRPRTSASATRSCRANAARRADRGIRRPQLDPSLAIPGPQPTFAEGRPRGQPSDRRREPPVAGRERWRSATGSALEVRSQGVEICLEGGGHWGIPVDRVDPCYSAVQGRLGPAAWLTVHA